MDVSFEQRLQSELTHLDFAPLPNEAPKGIGTNRFIALCPGNAELVLLRAKQVLRLVNQNCRHDWPDEGDWQTILPDWFVAKCRAEPSPDEAEEEILRLNRMSPEVRVQEERKLTWSLPGWLYYLEPARRDWYWWDADALDPELLLVAVEVYGWPYPWKSLDWLLRASGATRVDAEG